MVFFKADAFKQTIKNGVQHFSRLSYFPKITFQGTASLSCAIRRHHHCNYEIHHLCSTASLINSVGIKPSHQDFHSKPGIHLRVWRDAEISKGGPQCRHNHHIRLKHNIYRGIATGSLHPGFSFHRVT